MDNRPNTDIETATQVGRWRQWFGRRQMLMVKGGWLALIVFGIGLFSVALPVRYFQLVDFRFARHSDSEILRVVEPQGVMQALQSLGIASDTYAMLTVLMEAFYAFVFCLVAFIARRRVHDERWGMYISLTLVIFGTAAIPTMNALSEFHPVWESVDRVMNSLAWMLFGLFYYLFPDGRFPLPFTRALGVVWVFWSLSYAFFPQIPLNPLLWPPIMAIAVWVVWFGTGVFAQAYQYVRLSTPIQRQQTKWVVSGWTAAFALGILANLPGAIYPSVDTPGHPGALYELLRGPLSNLATLIAPASLGLAILRYRLWDIDLIINRTLVYVPLTALLAGLYTASVALTQRLFIALTGERSDAVIVFVTLLLATAFSSLRGRLQVLVDRRFKEVPDPTRELKAIGRQVKAVVEIVDQRELARRLLREAVAALEAESGAVYLWENGDWQLVETHGDWNEAQSAISVSLDADGAPYGLLSLGPRYQGLEYGLKERSALRETAGVVASALRATAPAA